MTDNLILWELKKIHKALTKTKEEHTLNITMIKPTENFNFSEPILNTTKIGLIRLSVYIAVFKVNRRNNQFLYEGNIREAVSSILAVTPGAHELTEIAQLMKEETNGNVIIEPDKNTMKCLMGIKQGAINFDVENSIAPLLGFRKKLNDQGKYASQKIIGIMGFSTILVTFIVVLYLVLKIMAIAHIYYIFLL